MGSLKEKLSHYDAFKHLSPKEKIDIISPSTGRKISQQISPISALKTPFSRESKQSKKSKRSNTMDPEEALFNKD